MDESINNINDKERAKDKIIDKLNEKDKKQRKLYDEMRTKKAEFYYACTEWQKALGDPEDYQKDNTDAVISFLDTIENNRTAKATTTGFEDLNNLLDGGLFPGLYVIGALSSLGKTSFCLQIAEQIAETGKDVLYITFEMSDFELIARSISRFILLKQKEKLTTREIMNGSFTSNITSRKRFKEILEYYHTKIRPNLFIKEADLGRYNIVDVHNWISSHIAQRKTVPVVIIDYLQIITPIDERSTDKQNMDKTITHLKQLSRDENIPIIAISSLNRSSYKNRISFEAFKESGSIEYSSDVVIGMQINGQGKKVYLKSSGKETSKIDEEKTQQEYERLMEQEEKTIEIIILKNRNGKRGTVFFEYQCKYNNWEELKRDKKL